MNEENYNRGRGGYVDGHSGQGGNKGRGHFAGSHGSGGQFNHIQKDIEDINMDIKSITISNSHLKEEPQFRGKNSK